MSFLMMLARHPACWSSSTRTGLPWAVSRSSSWRSCDASACETRCVALSSFLCMWVQLSPARIECVSDSGAVGNAEVCFWTVFRTLCQDRGADEDVGCTLGGGGAHYATGVCGWQVQVQHQARGGCSACPRSCNDRGLTAGEHEGVTQGVLQAVGYGNCAAAAVVVVVFELALAGSEGYLSLGQRTGGGSTIRIPTTTPLVRWALVCVCDPPPYPAWPCSRLLPHRRQSVFPGAERWPTVKVLQ
jgi:hypothetical protein